MNTTFLMRPHMSKCTISKSLVVCLSSSLENIPLCCLSSMHPLQTKKMWNFLFCQSSYHSSGFKVHQRCYIQMFMPIMPTLKCIFIFFMIVQNWLYPLHAPQKKFNSYVLSSHSLIAITSPSRPLTIPSFILNFTFNPCNKRLLTKRKVSYKLDTLMIFFIKIIIISCFITTSTIMKFISMCFMALSSSK